VNIYLIGYRGSGKSTVARHLATMLWWNWLDADPHLEQRAGRTIREIFATDGEAAFRDLESKIVQELTGYSQLVVALGGGAVLREENRKLLKSSGRCVWLKASPELLWSRIESDPTTSERRPNLTSHGGVEEVRRLLAERTPLYEECASLTVETDGRAPLAIASTIARWAEKELRLA
jgi:shikimate kinase